MNKLLADIATAVRLPVVFVLALLISFILHGLVLAMHFSFPNVSETNVFTPPLEVVLVNSKSATRPNKADALAQSDLDGGGNTDSDRRAKSPLPAMAQDQRQSEAAAAQRVAQLEALNRKIMTQLKSNYSLHDGAPQTAQTQPAEAKSGKGTLLEQSLEMAKLEAQIAQEYDAYQKRPRKMFIGARAQAYVFARYIEDWRIKVERIGNQNYPEEARRQKVYGKLQLTVSIKADGNLDDVEVTRSSGSKVLDAAAVAIVRRAAPYAPFPEDVRKKADVVVITRTWTFAPGDQVITEQ